VSTKYVVVTGAAGGIGKACVQMLLADGCHVFGLDIRPIDLGTSRMGEGSGKLSPLHCDVSDSASVDAAFADIGKATDRLHALVCCSGIIRSSAMGTMANEVFDTVMAVNVRGPWLCAKAALPRLARAATPSDPARIVFISSVAALRPKLGGGAYSASKAALENIMRALAAELASKSILVNAVAPGPVDTPFVQQALQDAKADALYKPSLPPPIGRVANVGDVAAVVKFLLGAGSNYVTGGVIPVDGGISALRA